jgi:hypothetical protein
LAARGLQRSYYGNLSFCIQSVVPLFSKNRHCNRCFIDW